MRQPIIIACILFALVLVGCDRGSAPLPSNAPTRTTPTRIASTKTTPLAIFTPTQSITPRPTLTFTPEPTQTPTARITSTPALISPVNAGELQREAIYTLPIRGRLENAEWSQDGDSVLVTTNIGVYLLDGSSLEQVKFFQGMSPISKLADNKWLVWSEGQRKYLYLEKNEYRLEPVDDSINNLGTDLIARNGGIAIRKTSDDEVEIVSLNSGRRQTFNISKAGYHLKEMAPFAISPDGNMLVIIDWYWSDLYFVNLETLEVAYKLSNIYDDPIFSPDGQYILVTDNGGIKVLKAKNGIQINRFSDGFIVRPTDNSYIYYRAMAYDYLPDSQHVGVVYCIEYKRCDLYIWSMATGQPETIVKGLPGGILGLDFTPSGKGFLTLSEDGLVRAWSVENQSLLAESLPFDRAEPVVSPDGNLVAIPRGSQIEIYNVISGELWTEVGDYPGARSLMVDSLTDTSLLVSGVDSSDKPFSELWDLSSAKLVRIFKPLDFPNTYSNETYCVHDQQERYIVCGSNPLQIFDIKTGELIYSNKSQEGTLIWAISPDGNTLATCTVVYKPDTYEPIPGDRIFLLDIPKSTSIIAGVLEAPGGGICSPMAFSADSQHLAVRSGYIWELGQQQPQASFPGNAAAPLAFNPDGSLLVSGNQVIETTSGKIQAVLDVNGEVKMVGFDPDGYRIVIETDQGVEVWKISGD